LSGRNLLKSSDNSMSTEQEKYDRLQQEVLQLRKRVAELEQSAKESFTSEEELNNTRETLYKIFQVAPTAMGLVKNRTIQEVNPMVSELSGYSRDELVGKSSRFLYRNEEEYNLVGEESPRLLNKYGIGTIETIWRRKDGTLIDVLLTSLQIDKNDSSKGVLFTVVDISSQKSLKNEKISSEERLKIIFENAPDGIYLNDVTGTFVDVNRAVEKITGYNREELIGKSFFNHDLISGNNLTKATKILAKNIMSLQTGPDPLCLRTKQGSDVWVEISTYPIKINKQRLTLGICRDISKRLEEEGKLKKSERHRIFHIQQSPLAIIEWNLDFEVQQWNPAAEKIFGYTKEEAIGQHSSFIINKEQENEVEHVWNNVLTTKKGTNSINRNKRKNGELILCEWHNTPLLDENDNIAAIASFAQDITERARDEELKSVLYNISNAANTSKSLNKLIGKIREELSTIIDTTNFFIALYNKESKTFSLPYFSDEKDNFSSFPAGKTISSLIINEKKPLLCSQQEINEKISRGEIEVVGSIPEIWLGIPLQIQKEVIGVMVLQSYNNPNAFSESDLQILQFVSNQISLTIQRKNSEEQMAQALERATEADKLKSTFLANMSHEIRTPLNGILGFTNLLRNDVLSNNERHDYLSIIEQSGKRMLGVINDLIDISKLESGMTEVVFSDFNLTNTIDYLFSFFKPEAESKGLQLSCSSGLPREKAFIKSDKEKIDAIITNLVKNAIKYTKTGGVHFGYVLDGTQIRFTVTDTGIGILKEKIDTIFNRFVQAGTTPTKSTEGVGLGLSITKAYVQLLNGKIWVESEPMKGSSFYIEIPYTQGTNNANTEEMDTFTKEDTQKNKLKILVAEDDAINRKLLTYHLKGISDDLILTANGAEAVEALNGYTDINLILMDLKMPEMDGYEATRLIREKNKEVIIIGLSAFALEAEKNKALQNGFNDYVTKPVSKATLQKAIGNFFDI